MAEIRPFIPQATMVEKEMMQRTLSNVHADMTARYQRFAYLLNEKDKIEKTQYDEMIQKAIQGKWLPYPQLKQYLRKLDFLMQKSQGKTDELTFAKMCIQYTILIDKFKLSLLESPDELSYIITDMIVTGQISRNQYQDIQEILSHPHIMKKLEQDLQLSDSISNQTQQNIIYYPFTEEKGAKRENR